MQFLPQRRRGRGARAVHDHELLAHVESGCRSFALTPCSSTSLRERLQTRGVCSHSPCHSEIACSVESSSRSDAGCAFPRTGGELVCRCATCSRMTSAIVARSRGVKSAATARAVAAHGLVERGDGGDQQRLCHRFAPSASRTRARHRVRRGLAFGRPHASEAVSCMRSPAHRPQALTPRVVLLAWRSAAARRGRPGRGACRRTRIQVRL